MEVKPAYRCNICNNKFSTSQGLGGHKSSTKGKCAIAKVTEQLVCDDCEFTCNNKRSMRIHRQTACRGKTPQTVEEYEERDKKRFRALKAAEEEISLLRTNREELNALQKQVDDLKLILRATGAPVFGQLFAVRDPVILPQKSQHVDTPPGVAPVTDALEGKHRVIGAILRAYFLHPGSCETYRHYVVCEEPLTIAYRESARFEYHWVAISGEETAQLMSGLRKEMLDKIISCEASWKKECPVERAKKLSILVGRAKNSCREPHPEDEFDAGREEIIMAMMDIQKNISGPVIGSSYRLFPLEYNSGN